jgi:hypothetical protein
LSSTTSRKGTRGQVLVIFAGGAVAILAVAALVFDIGQNLFEQRIQQDVSDGAALAGARWLATASCQASPSVANCPEAVTAARNVAAEHGFTGSQVTVNIPPASNTNYAGFPGHIQVTVAATRNSYFAGVLGITRFDISAIAVAANQPGYAFQYSMMALGDVCKAGHISGNGNFVIGGSVYSDSSCTNPGSLVFDGNRTIASVTGSCSTPGQVQFGPSTTASCGTIANGASPISDPLTGLAAPKIGTSVVPDPPAAPVVVSGTVDINSKFNQCPGQSQAGTAANPKTCILNPSSATAVVRLYPGVYYGGILMKQSNVSNHLRVYLEPGIYYMAGGGFMIDGDADAYTVDPNGVSYGAAGTSGIMVYNSDDPAKTAACKAGTYSGDGCIKSWDVNDSMGSVKLRGYSGVVYTSLVLFQDRNASSQPPVKLTGNANMTIEGTFYLPNAQFAFNGNGASTVVNAQVICDTFDIGGSGNLTVTWDPDTALQLHAMGLVQ